MRIFDGFTGSLAFASPRLAATVAAVAAAPYTNCLRFISLWFIMISFTLLFAGADRSGA